MSVQIELRNVCKSFGKTNVLKNLSFDIVKGDFVSLIGNNGCGKTTTVHILTDLVKYDKGQVRVFGELVNSRYVSYKNKFGFVLSTPYYVDQFNTLEYLKFVCKFQHVPKMEIRQRIDDMLDFLDFKDQCQKVIKNLSSGNKMKVSLAAALIHNPEVLVFDEPFVNLDIQTTEKIMSILKGFKGKKTLFITSHYLDLVADLCDRFLILNNGKIEIELNKKDFNNIESLKLRVKEILGSDDEIKNIEWLN